jgi:murein DD-endopeptidase MepM/ murein hydrolase activator NlpD
MKNKSENDGFNFVPPVSYKGCKGMKRIDAIMVNIGALIEHTALFCASKAGESIVKLARAVKNELSPVRKRLGKAVKAKARGTVVGFVDKVKAVVASFVKFKERTKECGFISAVKLQCSDIRSASKRNKNALKTFVNYTVPVASIAVLAGVIYNTASTSYGIAVEYYGTEIGVVTAESVVTGAQQTIADKTAYYSTEDEILVTANLSIKPLNAMDEVIDEVALAEKMEEQISVQTDVDLSAEPVQDEETEVTETAQAEDTYDEETSTGYDELDGKVRAYAVMINGEFYAAVESTDEIEAYLEGIKAEYLEKKNVVSVSFDKPIEYGYEQYVYPSQIVTEEDVINKLSSIVSEPVYYEVQEGDTPWDIAKANDMSVEELKKCFTTYKGEQVDDITEYCPIGATIQLSAEVPFLQVLVTKNVTYTRSIDYETVETEDPDMYKGETVVDVNGVEGEAEYIALITYKNGVAITKEVIEKNIISEPVTKQVRVGTRETTTEVSTGSGGSGDYFWPVDGGYISAYQGDGRGHKGIDIAAPYGTPIYAAESGTVTRATNKGDGYGNSVMISHSDGNETMYAHMSSIAISYGDYVVKGQLIGYVGATGQATGNHCHFEVRSGGYYLNPLDYVSQY